jgi:hypothetical protein
MSRDGKRLAVLESPNDTIVLWDLNDINRPIKKTISKSFEEKFPAQASMMISYDGTKIISFNTIAHKFFIWNVFNLNAVMRNVISNRTGFVQMNQNFHEKFVCVNDKLQNQILVGTTLSSSESKLLNEFNTLDFNQAKLIRLLSEGKMKNLTPGSPQYNTFTEIFNSLPLIIRELLFSTPEKYYDIVQKYIKEQ